MIMKFKMVKEKDTDKKIYHVTLKNQPMVLKVQMSMLDVFQVLFKHKVADYCHCIQVSF